MDPQKLSSVSTRRRPLELAGNWLRAWPMHPLRLVMLAALPIAVVALSPDRVSLSAAIAAAYVAAAILTLRGQRVDRLVIGYAALAAAWMVVSWLRSRYLIHLQPDQMSYATSKTAYFVLIVLPMAAAVALMIERAEFVWPTAVVQIAIGTGVAVLTVLLLGERFLGAQRYSVQGDLIALATVLAIQPWPIQRFKVSAVLGVIGVFGIGLAGSRQAVAAAILTLVLSAGFWSVARFLKGSGSTWKRVRSALTGRYVLLPVALVLLLAGYIAVTYAGDIGVHVSGQGVARGSATSTCNCVSDRLVSLETSSGDRDLLLLRGVHLLTSNPILGAGLGSFAGVVPDSINPGHFYEYPHNVLLEVASETGVVGLVLIISPLLAGWALLLGEGVRRSSAPIAVILMLVAVYFAVANVSGDIPSERGMWIFGLVAFKLGVDSRRALQRSRILARAA